MVDLFIISMDFGRCRKFFTFSDVVGRKGRRYRTAHGHRSAAWYSSHLSHLWHDGRGANHMTVTLEQRQYGQVDNTTTKT